MFAEFIQFSSLILSIEEFLTEICFGWPALAGWPAAGWLGLVGLGWLGGRSFLAGWLAGLLACRLGI